MKRNWKGAFPPVDAGFKDGMERAFEALGKEKAQMKRKVSLGFVLAAMLALLSATALAAGLGGVFGSINWFGEFVGDEELAHPLPTPAPSAQAGELFDLSQQILDSRGEKELVLVSEGGSGSYAPCTKALSGLKELKELLAENAALPVGRIPEGYRFVCGTLVYGCLPEGDFELSASESLPCGLSVSRYRISEGMDIVTGYTLTLVGSDPGDRIIVDAWLSERTDVQEYWMGVGPQQQASALQVNGMDNAVAIEGVGGSSLSLRRALDTPVECREFLPGAQSDLVTYEEAQLHLHASLASIQTLAGMFDKEQ